MQRYDFLKTIAADSQDALVVSTGGATREWSALRPSDGNLKTRTLGLVSSVACGIAMGLPHRKVIAIDGDGAFLMNLCGLPTIAWRSPKNLIHLVFDNQCHHRHCSDCEECSVTKQYSDYWICHRCGELNPRVQNLLLREVSNGLGEN